MNIFEKLNPNEAENIVNDWSKRLNISLRLPIHQFRIPRIKKNVLRPCLGGRYISYSANCIYYDIAHTTSAELRNELSWSWLTSAPLE